MVHPTLLIPQIKPDTRNWTARITITEDIPTLKCRNGSKLKRYILTDDEGNEIATTIFWSSHMI
ncbi:hypothetical protein LIER_12767 [Lithospermum erythrorhizon]|uniref:Uncharacterized protein n=1 Tax=Lithospermum erythrorhizon TaxID=34254 RepID=A0AAV3PT13_LITER